MLLISLISALAKLSQPSGARRLVAENLVLRQQLIVLTRGKQRAPKLFQFDRVLFGLLTSFIATIRLNKIAIALSPATLLKFHKALAQRKYHILYTAKKRKKPGPKRPSQELVDAIVAIKQQNPRYGYRRIAMQIVASFGVAIDKDVVRRVLTKHYKNPRNSPSGPSWLTFIGHAKDSLWSLDLFRCESINLKTHWVMLVMDHFTRRIIGFAVHSGDLSGMQTCCLFNKIVGNKITPSYLSSDNDPLFTSHRWQANLRVIDVSEIKSAPYVPMSHPFVERLIGTVRREYLDQLFFWHTSDLEKKLEEFQNYYNHYRCHSSLEGKTPMKKASNDECMHVASLKNHQW